MENLTISLGNATLTVDTLGAQLKSYKIGDLEYIWQRDPSIWRSSAPVLFPIVGSLVNETTIINGKECKMTNHGFARNSEFTCKKTAENKMVFTLKSNSETLEKYPYNFVLDVEYELTENGFKQTYIIENKNDCDMPYFIGAHPGFNLPLFGDKFEDYTVEFPQPETAESYRINGDTGVIDKSETDKVFAPGSGKIELSDKWFQKGALVFTDLKSRSVRLYNKQNKGLAMEFSDFDYFGIWKIVGDGADYVCLEPWTGINDTFADDGIYTHKRGIRYIKKGEKAVHSFTVTTF